MNAAKAIIARHAAFLALLGLFVLAMALAPALVRKDREARGARAPEDAARRTLGPRPASAPIEWRAPERTGS